MPASGGITRFDRFLVSRKGKPWLIVQKWQHERMTNAWRMAGEVSSPAEPGVEYDKIEEPIHHIADENLNDWFAVMTREDFEAAFEKDQRCQGKMNSTKGKYLAHFQKLNKQEAND